MTTEQLAALKEVAENRIRTERRNGPETTMAYSEFLNAADTFREKFTATTCLELLEEVERLREVEANWNDAVKAGLIIDESN